MQERPGPPAWPGRERASVPEARRLRPSSLAQAVPSGVIGAHEVAIRTLSPPRRRSARGPARRRFSSSRPARRR
jgi:hypothetical protein